jgi:anti-sigma regulatory factor (Ser/Thr protein kinase)
MVLELFSQARLLSSARSLAQQFAQRVGFSDMECHQIGLALDEALCNIINHGYDKRPDGRIRVSLSDLKSDPAAIGIVIEDRARQVDPDEIRSRDLDDIRPGGLGVFLMREIMDQVTYEPRDGGGMRLTMIKRSSPDGDVQSGRKSARAACRPGGSKEDS